eukprot:3471389-Alexandrium_andersonii.AAC.1
MCIRDRSSSLARWSGSAVPVPRGLVPLLLGRLGDARGARAFCAVACLVGLRPRDVDFPTLAAMLSAAGYD